jgi:hypothetical protein
MKATSIEWRDGWASLMLDVDGLYQCVTISPDGFERTAVVDKTTGREVFYAARHNHSDFRMLESV